jgi:hypothetical protein
MRYAGLILLVMFAMMGCGGVSNPSSSTTPTSNPTPPNSTPNLQGSWEFVITAPGYPTTYLEANLQQSGSAMTASSLAQFTPNSDSLSYCTESYYCSLWNGPLSMTVSGNSVSGTISENTYPEDLSGTIADNGNSISGTFQVFGTNPNPVTATFTANKATSFSGTYVGNLLFAEEQYISTTISQNSNGSITGTWTWPAGFAGNSADTVNISGSTVGNSSNIFVPAGGPTPNDYFLWYHSGLLYVANENDGLIGTLSPQ